MIKLKTNCFALFLIMLFLPCRVIAEDITLEVDHTVVLTVPEPYNSTMKSKGITCSWKSDNPSVCRVIESSRTTARIEGEKKGTATIYYTGEYWIGSIPTSYTCYWNVTVGPKGSDPNYVYGTTIEGISMKFFKWENAIGNTQLTAVEKCIDSANGKVTIPSSVRGYPVTYIANAAFLDISGLTELVIPNTVNFVENYMVLGCDNLRKITCEAITPPKTKSNPILTDISRLIKLYVPKGSKVLYANANGWRDFNIKEIGDPDGDIKINEENFPDDVFQKYLLNLDYGKDGIITEEEIINIKDINVDAREIKSLKGIEHFTSLLSLQCRGNQIASLDLSNNKALIYLDCSSNILTSLDVSNNVGLTTLYCSRNQISGSAMDNLINSLPQNNSGNEYRFYVLSINDSYEQNVCTKSQVEKAKKKGWTPYYFSHVDYSTGKYEGSDPISEKIAIDATNFPDANFRKYLLDQDYGKDGGLTKEEINNVEHINVDSREIKSLKGIEHFTSLLSLECSNNKLTSLEVSQNKKLQYLYFTNNQISTIDISENSALTDLSCNSNQLTSLNVSKNKYLGYLECSQNQLTSLDVSRNINLKKLSCWGNQLTSLDVSQNKKIQSLDIAHNQLSTIDISKNSALDKLNCSSNQLTSLDISKNTLLSSLSCSSNQLNSLDVSTNVRLMEMRCSYNKLTSLDLSKHNRLKELDCHSNQLISLVVSKDASTINYTIECYNNRISSEAMDALINSLPQNNSNSDYSIYLVGSSGEENVCTKDQVALAKAKGWISYYYNGGWVEYEGSDPNSIDGIMMDELAGAPIYNLNGQRIDKPHKGINIIRGKKVVIK